MWPDSCRSGPSTTIAAFQGSASSKSLQGSHHTPHEERRGDAQRAEVLLLQRQQRRPVDPVLAHLPAELRDLQGAAPELRLAWCPLCRTGALRHCCLCGAHLLHHALCIRYEGVNRDAVRRRWFQVVEKDLGTRLQRTVRTLSELDHARLPHHGSCGLSATSPKWHDHGFQAHIACWCQELDRSGCACNLGEPRDDGPDRCRQRARRSARPFGRNLTLQLLEPLLLVSLSLCFRYWGLARSFPLCRRCWGLTLRGGGQLVLGLALGLVLGFALCCGGCLALCRKVWLGLPAKLSIVGRGGGLCTHTGVVQVWHQQAVQLKDARRRLPEQGLEPLVKQRLPLVGRVQQAALAEEGPEATHDLRPRQRPGAHELRQLLRERHSPVHRLAARVSTSSGALAPDTPLCTASLALFVLLLHAFQLLLDLHLPLLLHLRRQGPKLQAALHKGGDP
mmetsp:Transcript_73692/g.216261  ORF Transcript_73692/g.216261 Transcript_73692/m.216261 type:complete len:449 (-) Transcript_73692:228-1574(-)